MEDRQESELVIPQDEVVRIVRLLGRIAGMQTALPERKHALMTDLSEMLDADGWLWSATQVIREKHQPVSAGVIYGGLSNTEFGGLLEAAQMASPQPPENAPLTALVGKGKHFTRTRQQVVPDEIWYSHPSIRQYWLNCGIDHFLYSIYPLGETQCSAIGFFRRVGRNPFTDLQRRICHIVISNVDWLHESMFPYPDNRKCVSLTPRQRMILVHLLDGKGRDEIAAMLHLSPETVKTHTRNIYQHFSVASQVELMRRFLAGNGGDIEMPG